MHSVHDGFIYGIGCDIINVDRIEKVYKKLGEKFCQRILTDLELTYAPNNYPNFIRYLAKRYSAKEAYSKAIGSGIGKIISFKQIEIMNYDSGQPYFNNLPPIKSIGKAHLSLTDDYPFVMAYVILEKSLNIQS